MPTPPDLQCISISFTLKLHSVPSTIRNHLFHHGAEPETHTHTHTHKHTERSHNNFQVMSIRLCCNTIHIQHTLYKHNQRQTHTHTHTYTDTSRGVSSPPALLLSGEVDLEVIGVIVDIEEAAALVELTDASDRKIKEDGSLDV